jgi:exonuclease SbcD
MKFLHTADLHIGKRLNDFSLVDDQRHILTQIIEIADAKGARGLLLSGDVYDKAIPSVEAVELLDDFITELSERGISAYIVSGNHDSPERLDFGSRILRKHQVHIAGEYGGALMKASASDEHGAVNIFLLPFLKPHMLGRMPGFEAQSFEESVRAAVAAAGIDRTERNILLAHQFVTAGGRAPETSDSETKSVGGADNIDTSVFDAFDYVALGHLHKPQAVGREAVRYSGSPLKYSFSEWEHQKSVVLIDMKAKGDLGIELLALSPRTDMRKVACLVSELGVQDIPRDSYVHVTLTDEGVVVDAIGKARSVFPNVAQLEFAGRADRMGPHHPLADAQLRALSPQKLFADFYARQNGLPLSGSQQDILERIFQRMQDTGRRDEKPGTKRTQ